MSEHTAAHCSTPQHTAAHCSTLQHTATHYTTLLQTATHCSTLQFTATHCNIQYRQWYAGAEDCRQHALGNGEGEHARNWCPREKSQNKMACGVWMSHSTHMNISLFCRALLQKRPILTRSLLIVATQREKLQNKMACGVWMSQAHIWISHGAHINKSWHAYGWVLKWPKVWLSHVTL